MPNTLIFLHGMESSPMGTKARFIKGHYHNCLIPELPPDIHLRMSIIKELIVKPVRIVGSSLGGLSALMLAMSDPDLVEGMILIAPAVGFYDHTVFNETDKTIIRKTYIPENIPCTVMIGQRDDVIPQADIEAMVERSPSQDLIQTVYRDDDHAQNNSLDFLLTEIDTMMSRI